MSKPSETKSKVNVNSIIEEMRSLYKKDKRVSSIISTGSEIRTTYTSADGVPLAATSPLRALLGIPCIPFNKIIQILGPPDCGKSTQAAESTVSAQKAKIHVIYWDSEDKFDAGRLTKMGGRPEDIFLIKTNETLKGGEAARKYINMIKAADPEAKILLVWDSVGGSQSRAHAERELDNEKHAQPGTDAKENSALMRMIVGVINKYPDSITMLMVNQVYDKIGFMQKGTKAPGGYKIEFHSSFIVKLKQIKVLTKVVKKVKMKYGVISRATVTKNHLSQSDTSIHELDFKITAAGSEILEAMEIEDETIEGSEENDESEE